MPSGPSEFSAVVLVVGVIQEVFDVDILESIIMDPSSSERLPCLVWGVEPVFTGGAIWLPAEGSYSG